MHAKILTLSVCQTLIYLSSKNGKSYCFPSQTKLLELLEKYYEVAVSRRTLNRCLKYMEEKGFILRRRRITKSVDGRYHFKSTLYLMKKKMFKLALQFSALIRKGPYWKAIESPAGSTAPGTVEGNGYFRNGFRNGVKKIIKAITET